MMSFAYVPAEVRAIFFDAVGTLIHPQPSAPEVYAAVGQRFGSQRDLRAITARFRAAFRRQEEQDAAAELRTCEEREVSRWRAIVAEVLDDATDPEACFQTLYEHFARPDAWRCDLAAEAILARLTEAGYRLGVASNFDERLRGIVAGMPSLRPLRHLLISSEIGWKKPAAPFFQHLCREVGLPPEQILLVGDDLDNDYQGGRGARLHALLLDPRRCATVPEHVRLQCLEDLLARPT